VDTALRLQEEPASQATRLADVVTNASRHSAATVREMIEALVVAAGGAATPAPDLQRPACAQPTAS
jgi:hypothetical protein